MKIRSLLYALALTLALPSLGFAEDPPGKIGFVGKNFIATANGTFHSWKVTSQKLDWEDLANSYVEIEIDVASIDTDNKKRDDHLRTPDFFDVAKYPTATVRVHSATAASDGKSYSASFDISMHGVEKTVEGEFTLSGTAPAKVSGQLTIDRMDFGIGEPETRNPLSISQQIPITFEATLP